MNQMTIFKIVIGFIIILSLTYEIVLYKKWRKRLFIKSWFRKAAISYWIFIALTQTPFLAMLVLPRSSLVMVYDNFLLPLYFLIISWQYSIFFTLPMYFLGLGILAIAGTTWAYYKNKKRKNILNKDKPENTAPLPALVTREDFLKRGSVVIPALALDSMPFVGSVLAFSGMVMGSREIVPRKLTVKIRNLPGDLQGLTIAQISDVHIGNLIHEKYLDLSADILKNMKADILVATGDIIDNNNYFLKTAGKFFRKIQPYFKFGMYGILGNHDYIDNGAQVYRALGSAGITMLRNENRILRRGNGKMNLMGLDYPWPMRRGNSARLDLSESFYDKTARSLIPNAPVLVLNHHPMDFIYLQKKRADLTLSGHTHGGQFILSNDRESVGALASNFYPYYVDLYKENGRQLYVNRGLGHWFPLRINCPAEITHITLV